MSAVPSLPARRGGPTIYDVAQLAGVSHTTVSRALNGQAGMADATRRHILEIVARLGFEPNATARVLGGRARAQLAAVTVGADPSSRSARLIEGVVRAAAPLGYAVTIVGVDPSDERSLAAAIERVGEQGVRGTLLIMDEGHETVESFGGLVAAASALPHVTLPEQAGAGDEYSTTAIALAVDHLRGLGHRFIAIASPRAAVSAIGAEDPRAGDATSLSRVRSSASPDGGFQLGRDARAIAPCTALIAPTVSFAQGVVRGLQTRGMRVPEDFAVVSLEDHMDAAHTMPSLTAVSIPVEEVTRWAVAVLHAAIEGSAPPVGSPPGPRLVVRGSTARVVG